MREALETLPALAEVFEPTIAAVPPELSEKLEPAELFHQLMEHRWFMSERAGQDVGLGLELAGLQRGSLIALIWIWIPVSALSQSPSGVGVSIDALGGLARIVPTGWPRSAAISPNQRCCSVARQSAKPRSSGMIARANSRTLPQRRQAMWMWSRGPWLS